MTRTQSILEGEGVDFLQMLWEEREYREKMKLKIDLTILLTNVNSKWFIDFNVESKMIIFLEDKIQKIYLTLSFVVRF